MVFGILLIRHPFWEGGSIYLPWTFFFFGIAFVAQCPLHDENVAESGMTRIIQEPWDTHKLVKSPTATGVLVEVPRVVLTA